MHQYSHLDSPFEPLRWRWKEFPDICRHCHTSVGPTWVVSLHDQGWLWVRMLDVWHNSEHNGLDKLETWTRGTSSLSTDPSNASNGSMLIFLSAFSASSSATLESRSLVRFARRDGSIVRSKRVISLSYLVNTPMTGTITRKSSVPWCNYVYTGIDYLCQAGQIASTAGNVRHRSRDGYL